MRDLARNLRSCALRSARDAPAESTTIIAVKHREIYTELLSPNVRDRLLATLVEEGILRLLGAHGLEFVDATPVPYVRLATNTGENGVVAQCVGVWFDVRPLVGPDGDEDYYLPVLCIPEAASEATLAHELLHLRDLLALIERDPSYPERASRLSVNGVETVSEIDGSIDFELFKIFAMEPQAYRLEFEMGETWIDVPCAGFRYHCATADELVAIRLADYVVNLERKYVERFPGHEATIQQAMRRWTNDHAGDVFRPPAYERIHQVNACAALMFLAEGSRTRSA